MHAQFDVAGRSRGLSEPAPRRGGRGWVKRSCEAERDGTLAELEGLRAKIADLERSQTIEGAMATLGLDDARLKAMLGLLLPARHGNSDAANEAAKWLNGLRDVYKGVKAVR